MVDNGGLTRWSKMHTEKDTTLMTGSSDGREYYAGAYGGIWISDTLTWVVIGGGSKPKSSCLMDQKHMGGAYAKKTIETKVTGG